MTDSKNNLFDYYPQSVRCRFNTLKGFFLQEVSQILYVRANGNYSDIYLKDGTLKLVTHTLSATEELLGSIGFKRVGRSLMINLNYLTQVDKQSGQCVLDLPGRTINLSLSNKHMKDLSELF